MSVAGGKSNNKEDVVVPPTQESITEGYQTALKLVDDVILKNYLTDLCEMEVVPFSNSLMEGSLSNRVRLFKIDEMTYEKDELATYKFASVFNSLPINDSTIFLIIDSDGDKTDFYMGVQSLDPKRTTLSLEQTVENAMKGQFPGIKTTDYLEEKDIKTVVDKIDGKSVSVVSCIANSKTQESYTNQNFVQGLEKLVLSMQGEKYTAVIIANGTSQEQLRSLRKSYEDIYTQLSALASTQVNYTSNNSFNYSLAKTQGDSDAVTHTENESETVGTSTTRGTSSSHTESKNNASSKAVNGMATAASMIGAALAPVTGGASLAVGGVVSGGLGLLGSAIGKNVSDSTSTNESVTENFSTVHGTSDGTTHTVNRGISETNGYTKGISEGMTLTLHDKSIEDTLERIDKQLKRIDEFESLGMYECATYFLSDNQYDAEMAASTYKALIQGENSGVEIAAVNTWRVSDKKGNKAQQIQSKKAETILEYVKNFMHPVFRYESNLGEIEVMPCTLISGNELAINMGLPRRSVCGLPVIEHAGFGKEVVTYDNVSSTKKITLGNIFNMGCSSKNTVSLDLESLSMHTFITGATGSGKSNTVYQMLSELIKNNIKFLVIEPTKGEYKNVFGSKSNVHIYGTNPYTTPLLHINPFKFDKGIHVLEHIDRLVEIFSVCWPMYAAMPAVLKEAILQAYEVCGWDLTRSVNSISDDLFPTFQDLLTELVNVIENSAYDEELKSNYKGSLETRVKSLTNGLNGLIFSPDEIDNEQLFDENVIIDLSRVGSLETKSLIMGILVMRLNEYRMTHTEGMNNPLKHVTILEEAHNLLKRTSTEQSSEEANVAGKSVEMISNAIAEMRTYGEGFIIVDQSPAAVDMSAIRNTNTKIIMRLPEESDRRVAGKSAALKDEQLDELAKLPKGVAVVYQNDWIEAVLCKIKKASVKESEYTSPEKNNQFLSKNDDVFRKELLKLLLKGRVKENIDVDIDKICNLLPTAGISTRNKLVIYELLDEFKRTKQLEIWNDENFDVLSSLVVGIFDCKNKIDNLINKVENFDELNHNFIELIHSQCKDISEELCVEIAHCFMKESCKPENQKMDIYAGWREDIRQKGGVL